MKVILGTDFSDQAQRATKVAASLAAHAHSPLTIVHAVEPGPIEFMEKSHLDRLRSRLQKKLAYEAERVRNAGIEVDEKLILGSPHTELVASAKRTDADLIVVASAKKKAPARWMGASVAERTAQHATVPTLIVREEESLLAWTRGERPLHVFIGYDFSASADEALRFAAALRKFGPCRITVAYVSWPPNETLRFGIGGDTSMPGNTPDVEKLLERDLKEKCTTVFGSEPVEIRVIPTWTREDAKLLEDAANGHADVILVGTNQRNGLDRFWLGSVSRAILRHAPMNVICVPVGKQIANKGGGSSDFERILVPIDFSESSAKAISLAFSAVKQGGEVRLLHVLPPTGGFGFKDESATQRSAEMRKKVSADLRALANPNRKRRVRKRVEVVEHQHPSMAIAQAAERFGADLICVGVQKRAELKKRLFGSTTKSLMKRSSRPVMIVQS
jgi:nucleotide-binding universal stress UspA family protein